MTAARGSGSRDQDEQLHEVQRQAQALYGEPLPAITGVMHVFSSVRAAGRWHVIKIGEQAPKSPTDFFVLNFWRAHCDAIVTTAQVARSEPQLSHELQGPLALGLEAYRARILGKTKQPMCVVMTRGTALSATHHMWSDKVEYIVLTLTTAVSELQTQLASRAEVVGQAELQVRSAIAFCRARGARCILIEAGPSTASPLYDPPAAIDHVMLSRFEAPVAPAAIGGALPEDAQLFSGLERQSEALRQEPSGPWRFERYARLHKR